MKIILVRHALTLSNKNNTISLPTTSIIDEGKIALDRTKEFLKYYKFNKVYTSNYIRTQQTAKYLGYYDFIEDSRIREIDFGDFKGKNIDKIISENSEYFITPPSERLNLKYPNGESRMDVYKRVSSFLDDMEKQNEDVLVISHGIAIRMAIMWVLNDFSNMDYFNLKNGSITIIDIKGKKKTLECVNMI